MNIGRSGLGSRRKKPKVAIAGAGYMAVVHSLAAQSAGMKVTSVGSRGGSSARHLAGELDARRVALDALPDGADVMIVATPPSSHVELALAGLRSGAKVLVEKPIATTLAEADELVRAATTTGATDELTPRLLCGENLLHSPIWRKAQELRPHLGTLGHLSLHAVQPTPDWGHFAEPLTIGGVLFDLGPHPVALALGLAGESPVAVGARLSSGRSDGADDCAEVRILFESGLSAELSVSWTAAEPYWSAQAASDSGVLRIDLVPEPSLEFNGDNVAVELRHEVADPRLESMGYVDQLLDLVSAATSGALGHRAGQTAQAARDVLEIICAAYASAGRGGEEVALPFTGDRRSTPMQLWRNSQS